jgi:hypothetical protein
VLLNRHRQHHQGGVGPQLQLTLLVPAVLWLAA